ncbi:MAG: SDR family NAD(P)-dependent oxidoreductase [Spirochaetales bacterium]|nr:SDR family NAD(P)-dependent oxidoreductase [Spirochaetales bacterium]
MAVNKDEVISKLKEIVGSYLHLLPEEIDNDISFQDLGTDSIIVIEIVRAINKDLDLQIESTDLYDYGSISKLSDFVFDILEKNSMSGAPGKINEVESSQDTVSKKSTNYDKSRQYIDNLIDTYSTKSTVSKNNEKKVDISILSDEKNSIHQDIPEDEKEDIENRILSLLRESFSYGPGSLSKKLSFRELNIDFMSIISVIYKINSEFGLYLSEQDVSSKMTVEEFIDFIKEELTKSGMVFRNRPIEETHSITSEDSRKISTAAHMDDISKKSEIQNNQNNRQIKLKKDIGTDPLQLYNKQSKKIILRKSLTPSETNTITPNKPEEKIYTAIKNVEISGTGKDDTDIAVIGMSARFPGAENIDEFWNNLRNGVSSIGEFPRSRYEDESNDDFLTIKSMGHLDAIDKFDPLFFNISPKNAEVMDPQQRLFLEEAWKSIEDAGYSQESLSGKKCGVFVGAAQGDYSQQIIKSHEEASAQIMLGTSTSILPARIAYFMNLTGPSIVVDTACSSALVATHLACKSITSGECEMALAGGVYIQSTPIMHVMTTDAGMLSADGKCKTFDNSADGFVIGEGVGVIVLKKLDQAIKDNDHIYGVIKGSGINQDGSTNGITAPSAKSQALLEEELYRNLNINPELISLIEAHGTGTKLGDPIEIKALTNSFRKWTQKKQFCHIGSVKTNIGHLLSAAGISGLIKLILCLHHKKIVPSLNFKKPNENLDFSSTPFKVITDLKDWETNAIPRLGAVSSFGFSGTNCHMIVSEAPENKRHMADNRRPCYVIILSAKTKEALMRKYKEMSEWLTVNKDSYDLADIAFTLRAGRTPMAVRSAFVVENIREMQDIVNAYASGEIPPNLAVHELGHDLPKQEKYIRELINYMKKELKNWKELEKTRYKDMITGLAELYCKGYGIEWDELYEDERRQRISLPPYPFEQERYWMHSNHNKISGENVNYYQKLHPMLHTNQSTLYEQEYHTFFSGNEFYIKDHIIGGFFVLPAVAYIEIMRAAGEKSLGNYPVNLEDITWVKPILVNENNNTLFTKLSYQGHRIRCEIGIKTDNNQEHVHFQGSVVVQDEENQLSNVRRNIPEIRKRCAKSLTPGQVYTRFRELGVELGAGMNAINALEYNDSEVLAYLVLPSSLENTFSAYTLHPSIIDGAITSGIAFLWDTDIIRVPYSLQKLEILRPLSEKCYSHTKVSGKVLINDREAYLVSIEIMDETGIVLVRLDGLLSEPFLLSKNTQLSDSSGYKNVYFREIWREYKTPTDKRIALQGNMLIFDRGNPVPGEFSKNHSGQKIFVQFGENFQRYSDVSYQVNPGDGNNFEHLFSDMWNVENIICRWSFYNGSPDEHVKSLFILIKSLLNTKTPGRKNILFVYPLDNRDTTPYYEALSGFVKSVNLENKSIVCKILGIKPGVELEKESMIIETILSPENKSICFTYDGTLLYHKIIEQCDMENNMDKNSLSFRDGGVYLISGGAGNIGKFYAQQILTHWKATIVLFGRTGRTIEDLSKAAETTGSEIVYLQCDVSDPGQMSRLIRNVKEKYGAINGIIHAAGITKDSWIINKTIEDWDAVTAPKIAGTVNLDKLTHGEDLDFFVMISSISALIGFPGQTDYSYANHFQVAYSEQRELLRKKGLRRGKTAAICYPEWESGSMKVKDINKKLFNSTIDSRPMKNETGWACLLQGINYTGSHFSVVDLNTNTLDSLLSGDRDLNNEHNRENKKIPEMISSSSNEAGDLKKIEEELGRIISEQMNIKIEKLDKNKELSKFGFDSISLTDFASQIGGRFNVAFNPALFFDHTTIASLAGYLYRMHYDKISEVIENRPDHNKIEQQNGYDEKYQHIKTEPRKKNIKFLKSVSGDEPLAIIGMHAVLPGVKNLDEFWDALEKGKSLISEIPPDRWNWKEFYGDPQKEKNRTDIKWGGFMQDAFAFDAKFFEISPREAEWMDPQQRILLETVYKTIENSGYSVSSFSGKAVGLFIGAASIDFSNSLNNSTIGIEPFALTGITHSIIPNRISYILNLRGPSEAIDTACSSSLVAVRHAFDAIRNNECETAIVGGVNLLMSPFGFIGFSKGGFLSKSGACKTFDADADGYVRAEGAGAVMLKPLSRAQKDGDHIYAVIRGVAVNHGGKATSLTAPNATSQSEVIINALKHANVSPETISYIEAHGTGTKLGDPTEVNGLKKAFFEMQGNKKNTEKFCGIGSVKTNTGHLEPAAGIAGMIKVILSLKNKKIPASINFNTLNPFIDLTDSPFYVVQETKDWEVRNDSYNRVIPRRAGISSFGFGGVNAHVILEEYNNEVIKPLAVPGQSLIILSAKDETRLKAYASELLDYITKQNNDIPEGDRQNHLNNMAFTLMTGRDEMPVKMAVIASDFNDLKEKLMGYINDDHTSGLYKNMNGDTPSVKEQVEIDKALASYDLHNLALSWTGGNSIDWKKLFDVSSVRKLQLPAYPFARTQYRLNTRSSTETVQKYNMEFLHPLVQYNYSTFHEQLFKTSLTGEEFFLKDHVIGGRNILPGSAYIELGRSAGAIATGGQINKLRDIIWLIPMVKENGRMDYNCHIFPGEGAIYFEVTSNDKKNGLTVHAKGTLVEEVLKQNGDPIDIHSKKASMTDKYDGNLLYRELDRNGLSYGESFQLIKSIEGDGREIISTLETNGHFSDTMDTFLLHPAIMDCAFQTITGFMVNMEIGKDIVYVPFSLHEIEIFGSLKTAAYVYASLSKTNAHSHPEKTDMKYDISILDQSGMPLVKMKELSVKPFRKKSVEKNDNSHLLYYELKWKKESIDLEKTEDSRNSFIVAFDNQGWLDEFISATNRILNYPIVQVKTGKTFKKTDDFCYEINPDEEKDYKTLFDSLGKEKNEITHIIHTWTGPRGKNIEKSVQSEYRAGVRSIVLILKNLKDTAAIKNVRLLHIYKITDPPEDNNGFYLQSLHAGIEGFANSIRLEIPELKMSVLGIDRKNKHILNQIVYNELVSYQFGKNTIINYIDENRFIPRFQEYEFPQFLEDKPVMIKEGGIYVITGGLGGLGQIIAGHLANKFKAILILIGRTELTPEKKKFLERLRDKESEVFYFPADISNHNDIKKLHSYVKEKFGRVDGILHLAGTINDHLLINKSINDFDNTIYPKVFGAINIDTIFKDEQLDFFISFSSTVAVTGNIGQTDYSYANRFLGYFTENREKLRAKKLRSGKSFCFYWPLWENGGMNINKSTVNLLTEKLGIKPLTNESGLLAFEDGLHSKRDHLIVFSGNKNNIEKLLTMQADIFKQQEIMVLESPGIHNNDINKDVPETDNIKAVIKNILGKVLKIEPQQMDDNTDLEVLGVTSIFMAEIYQEFENHGIMMPIIKIFELKTINKIVNYIGENGAAPQKSTYQQTGSNPEASKYLFNKINRTGQDEQPASPQNMSQFMVNYVLPVPPDIEDFLKIIQTNQKENQDNLLKNWQVLFDNSPKMMSTSVRVPSGKMMEVIICGSGKPVVILSGGGTTAPIWYYQIRDWSEKNQVIIIHQPGHGLSDLIDNLSFDGLAEMVKDVVSVLGINTPLPLIGLSMGGMMAQVVAAKYPDIVSHLILIGTSYEVPYIPGSMEEIMTADFKAVYEANEKERNLPQMTKIKDLFLRTSGMPMSSFLNYVEQISKNQNIEEILPEIQAKTMIISGEFDKFFDPEKSKILVRRIKGAEYWLVPKTGHFPPLTHPEEFNEKVINFIYKKEDAI